MRPNVSVIGAAAIGDYIFMVDRLPRPGEVVTILDYQADVVPGGCAPNIASGIAALGAGRPELYYPVGDDFPGTSLRRQWEAAGIDCAHLTPVLGARSGYAWLYMQSDGKTMCYSYLGAAALAAFEVDAPLGDWVVISPVLNAYTRAALDTAIHKKRSIVVSGISHEGLIGYLPHIGVLIVNQSEAQSLAEKLGLADYGEIAALYPELMLFVTCGKKGSNIWHRNARWDVPIVRETRIVDFTGAGDAYTSGVVSALIRGYDARAAGYIGSANASFAVELRGGQCGLPDWERVTDRLRAQYPEAIGNC